MTMTTGEALKRFRNDFHLKQGDVAEKIGMLQQGYYKYESDKVKMPVDVLLKIAGAFNVSTDYLLGLTDTPQNPNISDADRKLVEASIAYERALKDACKERGLL